MKKILFLSLALSAICMSACAGNASGPTKATHDQEICHYENVMIMEGCEIVPLTMEFHAYDFIASIPVQFNSPEFERPVPSKIGNPDTKRHFAWLFITVQKKC